MVPLEGEQKQLVRRRLQNRALVSFNPPRSDATSRLEVAGRPDAFAMLSHSSNIAGR